MPVKIGIIGDYDPDRLSHKATENALRHSTESTGLEIAFEWIPTLFAEDCALSFFSDMDGCWGSPGSPYKSMRGALRAIRFAREHDIPFIGTCGGFQHAVLEFAQNRLSLPNAGHTEYNPDAPVPLITPLGCPLVGTVQKIHIARNSKCFGYYGETESMEHFSCSYGINPDFRTQIEDNGFLAVGTGENAEIRILELPENRFHVATLFQPQLRSTPSTPHCLVNAFLASAAAKAVK